MSQLTDYIKVHKFLTNQMPSDQLEEYDVWLKQAHSAKLSQDIQNIWAETAQVEYPEFDYQEALNKHKLSFEPEIETIGPKAIISLFYKKWYVATAAVIVFVLSALFLFKDLKTEIFSVDNTRIVLDDGTSVWLDKNSNIEVSYSNKNRKVKLTGKAYFNVAKDKNRPFNILFEDVNVTVLGTSFIVDASRNIVSVKTGSIKIETEASKVEVIANQEAIVINQDKVLVKNIIFSEETLWFNDELKFKNTPLDKVISDVSAYYGVKILLTQQKDWSKCPFSSGSLRNNNLNQVLEILRASYSMEYERLPDNFINIKKVSCN